MTLTECASNQSYEFPLEAPQEVPCLRIETPLGWMEARFSEIGLQRLTFLDDVHETDSTSDPRQDLASNALLDFFEGKPISEALSLDIQGTDFQKTVWQFLQTIPPGQTRSYSDVAVAIGRPTAVRAVAAACARNPIALFIPCHRVIGKSNALTGYRWGIERKRALLELEAAARKQLAS